MMRVRVELGWEGLLDLRTGLIASKFLLPFRCAAGQTVLGSA